ncbi:MAG TPA: trypsin-like peptidase domain-containing protein [Thermoplasmata archaeon]|nr:trypsin-like peptidase domain-containing protein [Thermoplasmata archaeon]
MLPGIEAEITSVVERIKPAVARLERSEPGRRSRERAEVVTGAGSGVVIDPSGLLLTNDHVVREATHLLVALADGEEVSGSVRGEDPLTDLALVKLPPGRYASAPLGTSGDLRVGQFALAIGNSLGLPGEATVSLGVVSALGRPLPGADFIVEGLIQTDAAINPGNSGGPLVNLSGEVIGITTAIAPFAQGVGFAVPSSTARTVVDQLRRNGRVIRPWLGTSVTPLTPGLRRQLGTNRTNGLVLASVIPTGPAAAAGLHAGDVLFRVGSTGIRSLRDLVEGLALAPIGGAVDVAFARGGRELRALVRLAEAPAPARR